ncbi:hypothetical protein BY457_12329 [Marinilabilia salmonicolor]|jgi:hypothetical protein|uniref:hypothetical protein n=1 Tax=Marinilabilia salmonicolor TaxID=989 RepID=UPI000D07FDC9|nr:hypothetical protein [Marinilabilia salmonicolor]PRY91885.1 hypothetical protein BY457_12329 [Marinilabilia salmonicolor]
MENSSIITLLVVIIVMVLLYVILRISQTKKKSRIKRELLDLAEKSNSTITDFDFWNNCEIGFDRNSGHLFFIRLKCGDKKNSILDLKEVSSCEMNKEVRTISSGKGKQSVIDKLELILNHKNREKTRLEFYNTECDNLNLDGELQLTEKWADIVNNFIQTYKK